MNRPSIARRAAAILAAVAAVLTLASCGVRYYSATVSGYVKSSTVAANGTQAGINGAEVLIYAVDPGVDTAATAVARTSSMTSGGNDGYWSHKIMWTSASPLFADEGDSGTVWVKIMRKGYFPKTAKVTGILSDAGNVVPTIEMTAIHATELKGKVANRNGVGVDGVNVVLDLSSTVSAESDYTATTATTDGEVGVFTFSDIAWEDADSIPPESRAIGADGKATETYKLYIDDANWYSDANNAKGRDSQAPLTITSDAKQDIRTTNPITVRSTTFTVPLVKGRVMNLATPAAGVNGVTIAIDLPVTTNTSPDATVVTATLNGEDGWFQFENISWTNKDPQHSAAGLYDDKTGARIYLSDTARYSTNDADNPIVIDLVSDVAASLPTGTVIAIGDAQFKVPSVTGRVILKGTSPAVGENGVAVRLQLASGGQAIGTTTTTVGGVDGVFEFKDVTWTDVKPTPGTGGILDTEQARVYVQDNNYSSDNSSTSPMIVTLTASGSTGSLDVSATPLSVQMLNFTCPKVTGKVATAGGSGIAGVQVVLDLQSTTNTTQDATATTDKDGVFTFNNVGWSDVTPDTSSSDTEDIKLTLSDTNYRTLTALPLKSIASDTEAGGASDAAWTIGAERTTRWSYSVTLAGSCVYRSAGTGGGTQDINAGGVTVTTAATEDFSAGNATGLQTNAAPLVVQTANNGNYTATITWSRDPLYVPPSDDAKANGGDKLAVTVAFDDPTYVWGGAKTYSILSWSQNNIVNAVSTTPK